MAKNNKPDLEEENVISAPVAYITAAEMLHVARKLALENKDRATMVDIANSWIEIGKHLLTEKVQLEYDEDEAGVVELAPEPEFVIGFTGGKGGEPEEDEPESGPGTKQD
jgi:hypothetical protein